MGEALIWYRKRGGVDPELLKPQIISNNTTYEVPVTGNYDVYCVGSGGGGGGSCVNVWNTSQKIYGAGGTRGNMKSITILLNQGDKIPITIGNPGSSGVNNTSPSTYSNGASYSAGTSGTYGGSSSFGGHVSASGGSYGLGAYFNKYWNNVNKGWVNVASWNNSLKWNNIYTNWIGKTYRISYWSGLAGYVWMTVVNNGWAWCRFESNGYNALHQLSYWHWYNGNIWTSRSDYMKPQNDLLSYWQPINMQDRTNVYQYGWVNEYRYPGEWRNSTTVWGNTTSRTLVRKYSFLERVKHLSEGSSSGPAAIIYVTTNTYGYSNSYGYWNNHIQWSNKIENKSSGSPSIQKGTWWYLNSNMVNSSSGNRTYFGDGGASGQPGNGGFILIIPPQA